MVEIKAYRQKAMYTLVRSLDMYLCPESGTRTKLAGYFGVVYVVSRQAQLEEPAECRTCGLWCEAFDLNRCSLDAYADLSVDYDLFCPRCESDNIVLHKPRENHV